MHVPDEAHQLGCQGVLQHIGRRTGLKGREDVLVTPTRRQDHHSGMLVAGTNGSNQIESAHRRQLELQNRDIRTMLLEELDRLFTAASGRDDVHVRLLGNQRRDALERDRLRRGLNLVQLREPSKIRPVRSCPA